MDETSRSIVAQVCLKTAAEVYASLCDVSQGYQPALMEQIFKDHWRLHDQTMKAGRTQAPPPGEPGPFDQPVGDPMSIPPPPPAAPQPAPQSQPVAQPSQQPVQPQPVMAGPPCPQCQTPTVMTRDYAAKKARNLAEGKAAPPMWKCPMGSYDWKTKTAQGCQGSIWEDAA